jgi:hypothetical protein
MEWVPAFGTSFTSEIAEGVRLWVVVLILDMIIYAKNVFLYAFPPGCMIIREFGP